MTPTTDTSPKHWGRPHFCKAGIKGFADPDVKPSEIIQQISDRNRQDAPLLKTELTINAYIPTMKVKDIDKIMEVTWCQSQYVSNNKLNSAIWTLLTSLGDCFTLCSTITNTGAPSNYRRPDIAHNIKLHTALSDKAYQTYLEKAEQDKDSGFQGYPECVSNKLWDEFLVNQFNKDILQKFTTQNLKSPKKIWSRVHDTRTWCQNAINYVTRCVCVWSLPPVEGGCPLMRYQPQGEFTPPNACNVIPPFTWLGKLLTCWRHVGPTAECRHFWPASPCRGDTKPIPTQYFCVEDCQHSPNLYFSTRATY